MWIVWIVFDKLNPFEILNNYFVIKIELKQPVKDFNWNNHWLLSHVMLVT